MLLVIRLSVTDMFPTNGGNIVGWSSLPSSFDYHVNSNGNIVDNKIRFVVEK